MKNRALNNALKTCSRLGVFALFDRQRGQIFIDIFRQRRAQRFDIDITGPHHLRGVGIVD